MITKILLTLAVIAIAVVMLRVREQKTSAQTRPVRGSKNKGHSWIKIALLSVISLTIIAVGFFLFMQWQQANEVMNVNVVDSRSGKTVTYRVRRGELEGRAFETLDGKYIQLAETERLEVNLK